MSRCDLNNHGWTRMWFANAHRYYVMACAVMLGGLAIAAESISITATPRYPWNGKVDLKFTIAGEGVDGGYADPQPGDELIAGRRLRYVQSAGDVHLNTGVTPGSKNTIEMKFEWMDNPSSANECLFCARGSTITTATYTGFLIGSTWRFDYNTTVGGESDAVALQKGVPYVIRDVAGTASVNGTVVRELAPASFTVGGPLTLFSSYVGTPGNTGENYMAGKVYYLKIFGDDGTTLLHDFAPWEQNGKVGLYDLVGKKFVSASTGTLSAGQKYNTSFTAKDVTGGTNLTMKTLYKSNGTVANVAKEQLLPGMYNWVWDAMADLGEGTVLDRVVVEGKTVLPHWYVKFNANGGTGTMANEEFDVGVAKALTANAFTRTGYVFSGWATSASGAVTYTDKQSVSDLAPGGETINLYAVWKDPLYMVIDLSGGSSAKNYPVTYLAAEPSGGFLNSTYRTTKLVLRRLNAGSFKMQGKTTTTLSKPFYMGIFEVTQKQYTLIVGSTPSVGYGLEHGKNNEFPVYNVSYNNLRGSSNGAKWPSSSAVDSSSFMGKMRARTGLSFDLPTEAQWEYACRAGTTSTYYWGSSVNGDYLWYSGNASSKVHTVGTKKPNAWGLYDMSGNVWEWCLDWNGSLSYGTDPKGGTAAQADSYREYRGGCYCNAASYCTSSKRAGYYADYWEHSDGVDLFCLGFRLCLIVQ